MARIRSRGNARTELALARIFRAFQITGWRRQISLRCEAPASRGRSVPTNAPSRATFQVRPDFIFPKLRLAVFVDGCFWHGCPQHGTKPKGNAAFWRKKFAANVARDRRADRALRRAGWRVLRIWEHELARKREAQLVRRLRRWFDSGLTSPAQAEKT
jgi:DNA mismatch endonuclease (patch repair protein)